MPRSQPWKFPSLLPISSIHAEVIAFIHRGSTPHPVSCIEREDKRLCDEVRLYTNLNVGQTFHGAVLLLYREMRPL